ncbi:uncharacterized protein LOC124291596 [Haliotis rubra]|uniref:uncharacterized protein LOC124291596 n=1 Tax=Haliotis rubra TaxID=36100 RepID=UPI001EE4F5E0|nr:uncharacterized protein LOC124291596 [Haliotis rubra]
MSENKTQGSMKKWHLQIESNIKSASLTAIQMIKVKERKLLSELKEMSDRHIGQLKADIKSGEWYRHSGSYRLQQQQCKVLLHQDSQPGHSKLSVGGRPCGITRLKHNQVAVTVLDTRQIVTVEVNPDLVLLSTITTSKQYWGITSLTPSTLAASSHSPPCVDILDMSGHVLKSVCPRHRGGDILKYPNFLCTTRTGNILVSDWGTKCVVCLTPEGDVVFNYRPTGDTALKDPRGITSTSTGDILVTDNSQHRVTNLAESGQFVRNILTSQDGVKNPWGLCVGGSGRMYLCTSDVVKVFACCK